MNLDDENPIETLDDTATEGVDAGGGEDATQADETPAFLFEGDEGADAGDLDIESADDTPLIKRMRERLRQEAREKREAKQEAERLKKLVPQQTSERGPKPTLESCGWDEDAFERAVLEWNGKKSEETRRTEAAREAALKAQEAWSNRVTNFQAKAKEILPNFDSVAQEVADHFGDDDAGNTAKAILIYADDPRLIAALKNSPAKLAELVALKNDPTALAIAVGELKGKIKTMPRRAAPPPETVSKGGAPSNNTTDKELERLEREADRTGDRSAVIRYKRSLREKAA